MAAGTSIPEEVVEQLKEFHDKLTKIEDSLEDYFNTDSDNIELCYYQVITCFMDEYFAPKFSSTKHLETLDKARLGLMSLYTANSLYWVYLCTKGQRPVENEAIKAELERIKEYMSRLKTVEDRVKAPKLNPKAAKAFVRNALFDPSEQKPDEISGQESDTKGSSAKHVIA